MYLSVLIQIFTKKIEKMCNTDAIKSEHILTVKQSDLNINARHHEPTILQDFIRV